MTWENQQTGQHLSVFFCPEAWYTIYRKAKSGPAPEEPARRALLRRRVLFGNQFLKGRIAGAALVPSQGMAAQKPPARLAPAASGKPFPKRQNRGRSARPLLGAWRPKSRLRVLPLPPLGNLFPKGRIAGTALAPYSGHGGPKAACASCPCRLREAFSQKAESRAQRLPPSQGMAAQKPPARLAPAASGKPFPKRQKRGHGARPLLRAWRPKSRLRVLPPPQAASGAFFPRRRSDSPQSAWPCRRFCACGWPFDGRRSSSCC